MRGLSGGRREGGYRQLLPLWGAPCLREPDEYLNPDTSPRSLHPSWPSRALPTTSQLPKTLGKMSSRYLQQVLRLFGQVTDRLPCVLSPAYSASSLANSPRSSPSQSPSLDLLASAAEITEANNNNNNNIHDFDAPHASVQLPDPSHCLEVLLHWQRILSATPDGMPVPNTDYTRLTQNLDPNRLCVVLMLPEHFALVLPNSFSSCFARADNPTYLSYVRAEVRRQTMILLGFDPKFAKSVRKSAPPPECFLLGVAHLLHFANARSSTEFVATITNLRAAIADLTALTDTFGVTPALDSVAQHLPLLSEPRSFLAIVKDFQGRWKDVKGPWQTSTTHLRKTFFHDALFDYFPFMQPPVGSGWTKEAKEVYMLTQLEGLVNVGAGLVPDATEPLSFERTLGNLLGTLQFAMAQYHALRKALAPMAK